MPAAGIHVIQGGGRSEQYKGGMNGYVLMVAVVAASGGLLFGYDVGITGGVEAMPAFQKKFFPEIYKRHEEGLTDNDPYCAYNDHMLQLFSSSFFLSGAFMAFFAGHLTRAFGRKVTMVFAGLMFLVGVGLNASAVNIAMLVVGRILLGFGVGSAAQVIPLYINETAPFQFRGGLNVGFQLCITIGILVAQLINYGTQNIDPWGWRLSLGLAAVPAGLLTIGGLLLPESPNSLVERGHTFKGREVLERLRGTKDVDAEFADICEAAEVAGQVSLSQSWVNLFKRQYRPALIVSTAMAALQQLTGINAIMFYVPVLFSSLGSGKSAALLNAVIVGGVNVGSTLVSVLTVDKFGRRKLLLQGGVQMFIGNVVTGILLAVSFSKYTPDTLPQGLAIGTLVAICVFVSAFAWSWGPLVWLIGSEIQPLETRAAGSSMTVFSNFILSFLIGQFFLSMLCAMKYGVFLFFAGWVVVMTLFVAFLLPETKGVPIEEVPPLFARHWLWKRVMGDKATEILKRDQARASHASDLDKIAQVMKSPRGQPITPTRRSPFVVADVSGVDGSNVGTGGHEFK